MFKIAIAVFVGLAGSVLPASAQSAFNPDTRLEDGVLHDVAGRQDVNQLAITEQMSEVKNNSVGNNSTTGAVQIDGNAFQNLSGLSVVSANSGNNVSINSALNVTISLTPGI